MLLEELRAGRPGRLAAARAVAVAPRGLRRRQVVPPEVEAARRLLDA
jgi:hypothetical protein